MSNLIRINEHVTSFDDSLARKIYTFNENPVLCVADGNVHVYEKFHTYNKRSGGKLLNVIAQECPFLKSHFETIPAVAKEEIGTYEVECGTEKLTVPYTVEISSSVTKVGPYSTRYIRIAMIESFLNCISAEYEETEILMYETNVGLNEWFNTETLYELHEWISTHLTTVFSAKDLEFMPDLKRMFLTAIGHDIRSNERVKVNHLDVATMLVHKNIVMTKRLDPVSIEVAGFFNYVCTQVHTFPAVIRIELE